MFEEKFQMKIYNIIKIALITDSGTKYKKCIIRLLGPQGRKTAKTVPTTSVSAKNVPATITPAPNSPDTTTSVTTVPVNRMKHQSNQCQNLYCGTVVNLILYAHIYMLVEKLPTFYCTENKLDLSSAKLSSLS